MPPATPNTTRRPCQGRRGTLVELRGVPASVGSGSWGTSRNHDAAAPLDQAEVDVLGQQGFQRTSGQLLFQAGRHRVLGQGIQLARVAGRDQYTQVLAL